MNQQDIDHLRQVMGTLPSQAPEKNYDYVSAFDPRASYVKLVEAPENPYKPIVRMATSTWGDAELGEGHGSTQKWEKLSPKARYLVALSVLTGNTLPTAGEPINLLWEFNGVPRHTFDQFVRMRIGSGHASIGCRDNNKLDAPWVLYPELFKMIQEKPELRMAFEAWTVATKDLYEMIISQDKSSWQLGRAVLPMSYNHSWTSYTSLLALMGQMGRRLMPCEEAPIVLLFWKMRQEIADRWPLIGNFMRPVCDKARKCVYQGGAEGLTKYFSSLFSGCGRWPDETKYSEFNYSCTDVAELKKVVPYIEPTEWKTYTEDSFDDLSDKDKELFSES